MGEALSQGLEVTVTGLIIVFSVLIILMLVLMLMKVVFYKEPKSEDNLKSAKTLPPPPAEAEPAKKAVKTSVKTEAEDEGELIAVLAAAIASSLNTSTYNLKIKSFRRVCDNSPSWNKAGRNEVINSRF